MKKTSIKGDLKMFSVKYLSNGMIMRHKMLALLIFVLLTACGKPTLTSTTTVDPSSALPELPFAQELQDALDNGLEQYGGMGISAAIIVPGYANWLGVSGVSYGTTPITTDTLFSAGSATKLYTAITILQLAEEGVLTLEDPISKWLPVYPQVDSTISIRQLLNHTGGVFDMVRHPDYWQAMFSDPDKVWQPEEIITNFLLEPYFPKGTGWHYSTPGYILLRMIIKEATGSDLSSIYRERLLKPLALDHTFLAGEEELPENTAHGWFDVDGDGKYDDLPSFTSFYTGIGGGIYASAEDMAKLSHALFSEHRLLNERSYEQMLTFHSPTPGEPLAAGYGLGVVEFSPDLFNGLEIWGHSGNAPGFAAGCLYLPDYDVSIGIAVNTEAGEAMFTINDLLDTLTEEMHWDGESGS
jgi:D-alanyl-D-alanine carboxypeptidase